MNSSLSVCVAVVFKIAVSVGRPSNSQFTWNVVAPSQPGVSKLSGFCSGCVSVKRLEAGICQPWERILGAG